MFCSVLLIVLVLVEPCFSPRRTASCTASGERTGRRASSIAAVTANLVPADRTGENTAISARALIPDFYGEHLQISASYPTRLLEAHMRFSTSLNIFKH